jgi:hypothetical protein
MVAAAPLSGQTVPPVSTVRAPLPNDSLAIARRYALLTWGNQVDSLMAHTPVAERTPQNRQEMVDGIAQMQAHIGTETALVEERWVRRNGNRQYWRVAMFSDFLDEPVVLRIVIAPNGEIMGMGLNPLSQVPPVDPEH